MRRKSTKRRASAAHLGAGRKAWLTRKANEAARAATAGRVPAALLARPASKPIGFGADLRPTVFCGPFLALRPADLEVTDRDLPRFLDRRYR